MACGKEPVGEQGGNERVLGRYRGHMTACGRMIHESPARNRHEARGTPHGGVVSAFGQRDTPRGFDLGLKQEQGTVGW